MHDPNTFGGAEVEVVRRVDGGGWWVVWCVVWWWSWWSGWVVGGGTGAVCKLTKARTARGLVQATAKLSTSRRASRGQPGGKV